MIPNSLLIAVDFDGTVVEDAYPEIGKPKLFAFETLKQLQKDGHRLILWTYRNGRYADKAAEFCKENGVEFYAVNASFPGEDRMDRNVPRKINADIFIDDRNVGGFPGWGEVYQMISKQPMEMAEAHKKRRKKGFFGRR
ncbi:BT0820 family HAD-type phosphatase [Phaeocystidibacter luteus]|uniref:Hydrolase n=1 Tax=Phaeocystidibacter luteus TaxID=911197 RepID=A0A6N6REC6_9FLAO|nr:hydrolase [Phaeocystidibacter luteus]KAB2808093.1 hydrolase [Phaeocystidibacter luteus]